MAGGNLRRSDFELKTAFSKYWTSTKIKISMVSVYKEYEAIVKIMQDKNDNDCS